jgi:hypothetical protein
MSNKIDGLAIQVSQVVYDEYQEYSNGHPLPTSRSEFLHNVKFAHNYPHLQAWVEKCSISDYGTFYFHGFRVKA